MDSFQNVAEDIPDIEPEGPNGNSWPVVFMLNREWADGIGDEWTPVINYEVLEARISVPSEILELRKSGEVEVHRYILSVYEENYIATKEQ